VATRRIEKARTDSEGGDAGGQSSVRLAGVPEGAEAGAAGSAMTFEQAISRLGEIVDSLEEGEQPLEESIALFEEGMTLAKSSQIILDRAERRIEELLGVDAQGKPVVREVEPD
jgi:exodeoxyribonuclease VII small subunit